MTREEAERIVWERLPSFEESLALSQEDWRLFVKRNLEAMRLLWRLYREES